MSFCAKACCPQPEVGKSGDDAAIDQKPSKDRRCKDVLCLILFILSLGLSALVTIAAYQVGNPDRLIYGSDYLSNLCGSGDHADRPFAFYPRMGQDLLEHRAEVGLCIPHPGFP